MPLNQNLLIIVYMFRIVGIWRLSKLPYHYLLNTNYSVDEKYILWPIYTDKHQLLLINNTYRFGMLWRIWKSHKFLLFRKQKFYFHETVDYAMADVEEWMAYMSSNHHNNTHWQTSQKTWLTGLLKCNYEAAFGLHTGNRYWWLDRQGLSRLNKNVGIRLCR